MWAENEEWGSLATKGGDGVHQGGVGGGGMDLGVTSPIFDAWEQQLAI